METIDGVQARHFKTRKSWRDWLQKNNARAKSVWVILHNRNSKTPGLMMNEAVDVALCFGWIDSKAKPVDDDKFIQFFSKRKKGSTWSKMNKDKIELLITAFYKLKYI